MSEYLNKKLFEKWLENQYHDQDISHDRARAYQKALGIIQSGAFDADPTEVQRLRAAIKQAREEIDLWNDPGAALECVKVILDEALFATTTDTGAERVRELWASNTEGADEEYLAGIVDTLNAIGITVPGINAPEKEGKTE